MIEVQREDEELSALGFENCAFCRRPTAFWFRKKDVAVCLQCAAKAKPEDVPDKAAWCRREEIASASDSIEIAASFSTHKVDSSYAAH
jgi:hypothetical protein